LRRRGTSKGRKRGALGQEGPQHSKKLMAIHVEKKKIRRPCSDSASLFTARSKTYRREKEKEGARDAEIQHGNAGKGKQGTEHRHRLLPQEQSLIKKVLVR